MGERNWDLGDGSVVLGIDGGQTSTKALIVGVDGTVLGAGAGGPTVHYASEGGVDNNRRSVQTAMITALDVAEIDPAEVVSVGLGSTGVPSGGDEVPVIHAILREIVAPESISVRPDTLTNLLGASGGQAGIVVIAGGGAIGYGLTINGEIATSNGFGYWLGDEGSAFWIGMRSIEAACRASDRRGDPTLLEELIGSHFEIERMRDLPRIVYRAGFRRDQIAQLAPAVFDTARSGDRAAIDIVKTASHELALTALGILRQQYRPGDVAEVYPTGGVFTEIELFRDPFVEELGRLWPTVRVKEPRFPPVVGGVIVAARGVGINIDEEWLSMVEQSIGDS